MKIHALLFLSIFMNQFLLAQVAFQEIAQSANLPAQPRSSSIAVGDFNNDGFEDMFVCFVDAPSRLYKNNGNGTFSEIGTAAGVHVYAQTKTAVWGDINNDGFLDLYVANKDTLDFLFLNKGNESFEEIGKQAGICNFSYPLSANMADFNGDGFLDIYIANVLLENVLYINNGNNTFLDYTITSGATDKGSAMGVVCFDYDQDGDIDLYLTNLGDNILMQNNGNGTFTDISYTAQVADKGMGWGITFLDFDNDGWQDIYVANDSYYAPKPNVLFRNLSNRTFQKVEVNQAISSMQAGYATVRLDFDMDGQLDLAVANKGAHDFMEFFKNPSRDNQWLGIKLLGLDSNRNAIGAKIRLRDNQGQLHYQEVLAGSGWASQSSNILHFGLGKSDEIEEMTIVWPSGYTQKTKISQLNQYYTIIEGNPPTKGISYDLSKAIKPVFGDIKKEFSVYPNPNRGQFFIEKKENSRLQTLKIIDPQGKIFMQIDFSTQKKITVDVPKQQGIWLLQAKGLEGQSSVQFLVVK